MDDEDELEPEVMRTAFKLSSIDEDGSPLVNGARSLCRNEMHTSPTSSRRHLSPCIWYVPSGLHDAQPWR